MSTDNHPDWPDNVKSASYKNQSSSENLREIMIQYWPHFKIDK